MKIISVFEAINKKMYFSPDHYSNHGAPFKLQPREKAILVFKHKSNNSTDHFKIKFTKKHFYLKFPSYKFIICIQNTSQHRKLVVTTGCILSKLLEHPYVSHYYSNMTLKDLRQAQRFKALL
jgi:hypothetical protein